MYHGIIGKARRTSIVAIPNRKGDNMINPIKARDPKDTAKKIDFHTFGILESRAKRIPNKTAEAMREMKHIIENCICNLKVASVYTPAPTAPIPTKRSPIAPITPETLSLSACMRAMENNKVSNPVNLRPELKITATLEIPRSLRALYVQSNQGERAIDTPINAEAHTGAKIPIQAAIFGSKIFLKNNEFAP